ncbi:uncharacterized protein LOC135365870 [Ornithodoros turicata]|uniref:uncharacterized protein LOC135365870 n=1 Tax=Ornithodoros turicata TaxID=34597 RepID=UPI0031388545
MTVLVDHAYAYVPSTPTVPPGVDSEEEDILRKHVKHLEDKNDRWTGYLVSEKSLREMERELLTIGVSFKTATSHYREADDQKRKLMFSQKRGNLPMSLSAPFRVLSVVQRGCLFGKDKHGTQDKRSNIQTSSGEDPKVGSTPDTFAKRKAIIEGTKKKGCTAALLLKYVELFPDFEVHITSEMSEKKKNTLKADALGRLMDGLSSTTRPTSESRIYFVMSKRSRHINHKVDTPACLGQAVEFIAHMVLQKGDTRKEEDVPDEDNPEGPNSVAADDRPASSYLDLRRKHKRRICAHRRKLVAKVEKIKQMAMCCTDLAILKEVNRLLEEAEQLLVQGTPTARGPVVRESPVKGCPGQRRPRTSRFLQLAQSKSKHVERWRTRRRVGRTEEPKSPSVEVPEVASVVVVATCT